MERRSTSTVLSIASSAWERLLDVLYPPRCGGCDRRGTLLCDDCYSQIEPPYLDAQVEGIDAFASAGLFKGPLREAVHKLKYQSDTPLARPLARLLSEALSRDDPWSVLDGNPPMLMHVPLHSRKEQARGYNQSALLTRELSRITGWRLQAGLVRIKETQPQVGLSAEERQRNVAEAFAWEGDEIDAPILLVDDVCTTGATLSQCAATLKSAGAGQVYAVTVAKAVGGDDMM
ncbi:MAG TPA: ComF family protein [Chloroflexia bacterium]|nr:ComF family protein [Chloroflexia bacterium]